MIKSIKLIRFKQFKETEIQLRPFSILMGENNSGKTSVLQAIWLALSSLNRGNLISLDKGMHTKVSESGFYMFDVPFVARGQASNLFFGRITRKGQAYDETSGAIIEIHDAHDNNIRVHLKLLFNNLNFKVLNSAEEIHDPEIQKYEPLYISGFVGLRFQEERMFPATLEERTASGNINLVVRNIILDLKRDNHAKFEFLDALLSSEFGFHIKDIHFDENSELYVFSEYEELTDEGTISLEFSSCGSGIMQILQIISVILRYCPEKTKVVLIDEPDAHLHNNLQIKFANILMKIQRRLGIQIILSTHSTAIIQNTEPEDVIPILSAAPVNTSLSSYVDIQREIAERLDAYELGKAKISGKIAFFEDKNLDIFHRMADVAHIDCFSGVNTIPVIGGRGKDDKLPFSLKPILRELLGRDIEIHVIRDSDGMSDDTRKKLIEYAERNNVILHVLSHYEIENYVLNPNLILRAIESDSRNARDAIPSVEEISEMIHTLLQGTIRDGIFKYSTVLSEILYKINHNLLGDSDYKTDNASHEADTIYRSYHDAEDPQFIHGIGMGKQAYAQLLSWLGSEKHLKISKKDVLLSMTPEDVPKEIKDILTQLKSDLSVPSVSQNVTSAPSPSERDSEWGQLMLF